MERKRYSTPDPRKRLGREPLPPKEEAVNGILRQLGLPELKLEGNQFVDKDGKPVAIRGIDEATGKRTLTLCGEGRAEPYTIFWDD